MDGLYDTKTLNYPNVEKFEIAIPLYAKKSKSEPYAPYAMPHKQAYFSLTWHIFKLLDSLVFSEHYSTGLPIINLLRSSARVNQ